MFENPIPNANPAEAFAQGYKITSDVAQRKQALELTRAGLDLDKQKLLQQQAVMTLGQQAARTGDPRLLAMYSSLNPEGAKGLRENIQFFIKNGLGDLQ